MSSHTDSSSHDWTKAQERGSAIGLQFMIVVFRVLGRRVCLFFLIPVTLYFFLTGREARRASRDYLKRLYAYTGPQKEGMLRKPPGIVESFFHFYEFARAVVDRAALWMGERGFSLIWNADDRDEYIRLLEEKQGVVLLSAHFGNVEVLRALSQERPDVRVNALMYTSHATRFNSVMRKLNPDSGLRLVPLESISSATAMVLNQRLAAGEFVSMLADRVAAGAPDRVIRLPFLGAEAAFPQGPFILASVLQAPLYIISAHRESDAVYRIYFERVADRVVLSRKNREADLRELMQRFVSRVEHYCIREPYQWFNFYDFWSSGENEQLRAGSAGADRLPIAVGEERE